MTDRDLAIARAALEAAVNLPQIGVTAGAAINALDPATIVAGVPEFSVAAGFRHVPEDVHRLIVQERDALRARIAELEATNSRRYALIVDAEAVIRLQRERINALQAHVAELSKGGLDLASALVDCKAERDSLRSSGAGKP